MLRRKATVGDVVRIVDTGTGESGGQSAGGGGRPRVRVVIRTVRHRRGRRTEVVQEIDAPGLSVRVQRGRRVETA